MKYTVTVARIENYAYEYEVEADNDEDARAKAMDVHRSQKEDDGDLVYAEEFVNECHGEDE